MITISRCLCFLAAFQVLRAFAGPSLRSNSSQSSVNSSSADFADDLEEDGHTGHVLTDDHLREMHAEIDRSKDAKLSAKELLTFAEQHHKEVMMSGVDPSYSMWRKDTSNDGFVSLEEHLNDTVSGMAEYVDTMRADETAKFRAADTNGDGVLDSKEMHSLLVPASNAAVMDVVLDQSIRDADSDKSGKIDLDEFRESKFANRVNMAEDDSLPDGEDIAKQDKAVGDLFKRLDKNGDGSLDKDELRDLESGRIQREDMVDEIVSSLDKDGDKQIDSSELIAGRSTIQDNDIQGYLISWARRRAVLR